MKKLILTSVAFLSLAMLTGCSTKQIASSEDKPVETHKVYNKVIVKTFSSSEPPNYEELDEEISTYLSGIKNINDYSVKITSGGHGEYGYSEVFETVVLIKKG